MTLEAGTRLGHYRILGLLGRGGMAEVYRAEDERLGREVALKVLPPELSWDPERVERFEREVRATAKLSHANIVTVHEYGRGEGQHFYTMELMRGGDLKSRIRASPGGMTPAEAAPIAAAVARALDYAHRRGFVHRDVKPENILFDEDGSPQLTDFGIVWAMSDGTGLTAAGKSIGSPHYMSPEQARGQAVDGRSDLYSLGVVFQEMLTGRPLFDAEETLAVMHSHAYEPAPPLPDGLSEWQPVLDRMLAKSPEDRYGSAGEFAAVLAGGPPSVSPTRVVPVGGAAGRTRRPAEAAPGAARAGATGAAGTPHVAARGSRKAAATRRGLRAALAGGALALVLAVVVGIALRGFGDSDDSSGSSGDTGVARELEPSVPGEAEEGAVPGGASETEDGGRDVPKPRPAEPKEQEAPSDDDPEPSGGPPEPPPAPAPLLGGGSLLVVETVPVGVEVLVDGQSLGATPLERGDIRAGVREVLLRHPHYEPVRLPGQSFSAGRVLRIERSLVRGRGALTVLTEPRESWVELDGRRLAEGTPVTLEDLPAGRLSLVLGAPEHAALEVAAEVPLGGVGRVERRLERIPYGTLTVEVAPADAEVSLPGVGEPYRRGMRLRAGPVRVVARRSGYVESSRTVSVSGDTRVRMELDRREWRAGAVFRDDLRSGGSGPEMVVVPAGSFRMGCVSGVGCRDAEKPVHGVTISESFALGVREVTRAEFSRFVEATGHRTGDSCRVWTGSSWASREGRGWRNPGFEQTGSHPVVCVSWDDAEAYVSWLSSETGVEYRLPSESEWEYSARAGSSTAYSWGNEIGRNRANCDGCGSRWDDESTAPVGSFRPNAYGLYDMHGNVWEWVEDCWNDTYRGAPSDGSSWTRGNCSRRVLRGGSWYIEPRFLRSAFRGWNSTGFRIYYNGFRVARTLTP